MHRAYPLPLEKPWSLTLSCGLGFGFRLMILAYFVDHFVTFQGISLDFLYLLRGRRRQSPFVRGVVSGIITRLQCHLASNCKSRTLCGQMYAKVHVVPPIAKVHLVTPISKMHLVTPLYTADVNYRLNSTTCKIVWNSVKFPEILQILVNPRWRHRPPFSTQFKG